MVIRAKRILRGLWSGLRKMACAVAKSTTVTYPDGSVACFDLMGRHYRPSVAADECSPEEASVIRQLEDLWQEKEPEAHLIVCISSAENDGDVPGIDPSAMDLPSLRSCPKMRELLAESPPAHEIRVTTAEAAGRRHPGRRCFHFPVSVTRREWEKVAATLESGHAS